METWRDRLRDAQQFLEIAEVANDETHGKQAASNAILAAIAANDAVCLFLSGTRPAGKSHSEAPQALQTACRGTRWERDAAGISRQLADLLQRKNEAQYLGRLMRRDEVDLTMKLARQVVAWALTVLPAVRD